MLFLRQATASQEILLGPFLDDTDGKTPETALTIANTDIKLWAEGATSEASKNSGGATHIASGRYYAVFDATDSATAGKLEVNVHVSGALPVRREFMVLPAMVYDSMVLGTDTLEVDATKINNVSTSSVTVVGANLGTTQPINFTGTGASAVVKGDAPTPPTVGAISTQVAADLLAAHGSGDWRTATGFATPSDVTTSTSTITTAIGNLAIPSAEDVVNELMAYELETGVLYVGAMRLGLAANGGKTSLSGTTFKIRDLGDTKDVVTATVTEDGERTAVATDLT